MDSYESFFVPDGYEKDKLKERRSISVNELFERKEELAYKLSHAFDSFEMTTGVKIKSVKFDLETGLYIQLDI